ncbi:Peroxiredoxin [Mucilaginibacter lappiensis]|uniref:Peroxiredoxin n=1 Tax=Mucilaginibacter lappiensis TaxID=354630 RepID=A0ABR6PHC5_9SPHI|nr:TlpA disulfide reductase family protein [Mucilaginibacter lappiensis]MBB6107611.1 peroxiredoxin [Mucilaginibacter lappiensis]SIQ02886.1 Peroxiredoxin [Mucilaginibacter lappiensis]
MKKIVLAILFVSVSKLVIAQTATEKQLVIFKGITDTAYNGKQLVLYNKTTGDHDSVTVANGGFELSVPYKEPTRYMFYSKYELKKKGGYSPYGILISKPGTIHLKADMETLANSVITDAPENELLSEFMKGGLPLRQQIQDKLKEKFGADVMEHLNQKDPKFPEIYQYYNELNEAGNKSEAERLGSFIKQHPDAFVSVYLLNTMIAVVPAEKAQFYYNELGPSYKTTSYNQSILKAIEAKKVTAIGKMAPDFEQPDTSGKMVKLSDFKGKYVLLDFWASWCGPCREENPNVVKAYALYKDKGFTVLGVSLDQPGGKAAWLNAIHHDQLTWTQVSDLKFWNNEVAKLYGIRAIPQNFLLDKEGKIIAVNIKGDELDKKLQEIFRR